MGLSWLHDLSWFFLGTGVLCALIIAVDLIRHPQQMWIMNLVWPINGLFGTVPTIFFYFRFGRLAERAAFERAHDENREAPSKQKTPFPVMVAKGTMHCGAGCALGDIIAESLIALVPTVAVWAGWKSLFAEKMFAAWIVDYIFAFCIGVGLQYFTIVPMRGLSVGKGLIEATKADVLSLSAWQIGMYGFMAVAQFYFFRQLLGTKLEVSMPEFWFMMQIAMIAGFFTSYPVNWWLICAGIKERM